MKKMWMIILLGVVFVAIIAGYILFSRKTSDAATARAHYVVTASELIKEFSHDGGGADEKYGGKILRVSGTVIQVSEGGALVIGTEESETTIVVGVDQRHSGDIHKIKVGDEAILQGVYSGYESSGQQPDDLLGNLGATIQLRSGGLIAKP